MPVVTLNGVDLYYEIKGEGPPLIFTHGHSMNHEQWEPQVNALSSFYQIITWDARGHGHSTLPPGPVDPRDFSRDLHSLIDYLQLKSVVLCGLSMGGHISLQTALFYPEKIRGLI
ncbi:alpha/beta fold hydrolase [Alkalicoccobacillus murimartini]|uniref:Pimeloyl-ACP methyl ester carboxylesterase n=1 Tax=Alkalicoccobacillus murimartini TaxID=171685 RepID=A0ABT9YMR1_9BACI|nr:alpha/beta hydrolase [Alkalicoccobacillus murimartini]MDQ0208770.1 pimeloyl-ACP methyl ester carboxylesterase [Alkalicoccobacillus murimartini]